MLWDLHIVNRSLKVQSNYLKYFKIGGIELYFNKKSILPSIMILSLVVMLLFTVGCSQKEESTTKEVQQEEKTDVEVEDKKDVTIKFMDNGWDSLSLHNEIAGLIIREGYGYNTEIISCSVSAGLLGLKNGDLDIRMENWLEQVGEEYTEPLKNGDIVELGVNFNDNIQGFYVPTYIIEGDAERDIEPIATNLKSIEDLPNYWEVFKDPEDPNKGQILGAPPTWITDEILRKKVENYGLNETYNYVSPGSDAALSTAIAAAYKKGKPIIAYYWEPTWVMGQYDMTLIEEPEYNREKWEENYNCAFPSEDVTIAVNKGLPEKAPKVAEFLKKYNTNSKIINEALAYIQDNDAEPIDAAKMFLREQETLWTKWVPEEVATKVKDSL